MSVPTLVRVPQRARAGEVIEVSAMISHPMETGFRTDAEGRRVPRNIVRAFSCHYDGTEVFSAQFHPAITANPYVAFNLVATRSGTIGFRWEDDRGVVTTATASLIVE
jgi:sulfur-oxidizing protein SoxZ